MFTKRFFIILTTAVVIAVCAYIWPWMLWVSKALAWGLAVWTVIDGVLVYAVSRRIRARREYNERMSLEQPNAVTIDIDIRMPQRIIDIVDVEVYDMIPATFGRSGDDCLSGQGRHTYYVYPTMRGRHEFGRLRCFVRSRWFGLCEARNFLKVNDVVNVYPTFRHLDKIEMMATTHKSTIGSKRVRKAGNSTDFDQIRPYVPGDDVRTINWRATARAASLMVNTYTDERSQPIIPVVCAGPSMLIATEGVSLLDRATSAAVALASSAIRHYDEAGLITVTHKGVDSYLSPERATNTVAKVLERTYSFGLPPTESEQTYVEDRDVIDEDVDEAMVQSLRERMDACEADPDFEALAQYVLTHIKRKSLLMLFANFENLEVARVAMPEIKRMSKRHAVVVVLFENEGVSAVAKAPYTKDKVSQKLSEKRFRAICADYIAQQQLLAAYLRKQGVNVIVTPPSGLTASVLQQYLEMKNRATI